MGVLRGSLTAAAAVTVLVACTNLVDPDLPAHAEEFTPPPVYARWWSVTESCSGLSGDLSAVTWFRVPATYLFLFDGKPVEGYWSRGGNRIVMAGAGTLAGGLVRHEMLHALIKASGHPRAKFLNDCGGVVTCNEACITEAGGPPPPDPAAARVGPEPLEVHVDVEPTAPSRAVDDGFFAVIVSVRNPMTFPINVVLPPHPIGGGQNTFAFDFLGQSTVLSGNEFALDPSVYTFAAGETKRHVFDFRIATDGGSRSLPSGTYTLRAGYGGNLVSGPALVLLP